MGRPIDRQGATDGPTVSDSAEGTPAGRLPGRLSRERIVAGAISYVGRNCLADLSMRRLGRELGVEAMSLYRYFPSKAALFSALADAALAQIAPPEGEAPDWESAVRCYAHSFRRFAKSQPRLFPLLAAAGPGQRSVGALMARMLDIWRRAGLDEATARHAQGAVHSFTIGTISAEVGVGFGRPSDERSEWCPRPAGKGPAAAGGSEEDDPSGDAAFEFSLDVLIDGLRDRCAARKQGSSTA
ncbi:MAG: TetR/AcrR family transcriptional regulator C-terminal domain-containing protein [Chloroflexi bacterium]|nr:TetR/AcrR family transcriptional regulator C-terminal domain-containing protein [Chloroflexota bacterium]